MTFKYTDAFVTLAALDSEGLIEFYRQLLGKPPDLYLPGSYAEFQLTGLRLGIFQPKSGHQLEFDNAAGSPLSICLEVEDLSGAIAHLHEIGYPPPGEIMTASHGKEIYAYDPLGNRLILHQS